MVLSLFAKLRNKYFQQFIRMWGREPQTPKEWMDIQDNAVREINETKGVPGADPSKFLGTGKLKVIQGGKGIKSLLESGDVKVGVAPKTSQSRIDWYKKAAQKQRYSDDFYKGPSISKEEWIAKKKAENKAAIERFKEKTKKKTVEDFRDEGDWDPGGFAGGGIARPGYFLGNLV